MSGGNLITYEVTLVTEECCSCGVLFAMPTALRDMFKRKGTDALFYCPNGHPQHYLVKSLSKQLAEARAALDAERDNARSAWQHHDIEKAARKKLDKELSTTKRRAAAAVCPVPGCKRSFVQMERHLASKHPAFIHERDHG